MLQAAVFVDAGYLYAQGSVLLAGKRQRREDVRLNIAALLDSLRKKAVMRVPNGRLLRIYWYDALLRGSMISPEQRLIAESEDVKCRYGTINGYGEQKGVDSLIVTDLVDLARNRIISDAILISGDEDIRIGVSLAQTYGVRVHLVGLKPARGSQSPDLIAESDTLEEWDEETVSNWMTVPEKDAVASPLPASGSPQTLNDVINSVVNQRVSNFRKEDIEDIHQYAQANANRLPQDFDRPSLARMRDAMGRDLDSNERTEFRRVLLAAVANAASIEPS